MERVVVRTTILAAYWPISGVLHLVTAQGVGSGLTVLLSCMLSLAVPSHEPSVPVDELTRIRTRANQDGGYSTSQPSRDLATISAS